MLNKHMIFSKIHTESMLYMLEAHTITKITYFIVLPSTRICKEENKIWPLSNSLLTSPSLTGKK